MELLLNQVRAPLSRTTKDTTKCELKDYHIVLQIFLQVCLNCSYARVRSALVQQLAASDGSEVVLTQALIQGAAQRYAITYLNAN